MTNKEIAKKLYEDENIVFGMIDKPNIIITNEQLIIIMDYATNTTKMQLQ